MPHTEHPVHHITTHQPMLRLEGVNTPWREVLHLGSVCRFSRNQMMPAGRDAGMYLLTRGSVRIRYTTKTGHERHFLTLGQYCIVNELPALAFDLPGVSLHCLEGVEAWRFQSTLLEDPAFCSQYPHLMSNLLRYVARKLGTYFFCLSELGSGTSLSQLCTLLLLARNQQIALSQSELGAMLGLHQTTVARMVRALRDEGVIGRFTKHALEVRNPERLRALAEPTATLSYNPKKS